MSPPPPAVTLREATRADLVSVAALHARTADGGAVRFSAEHHLPAGDHYAGIHERSLGVVAESDEGRIIGAARLHLGDMHYEGEVRPYALLSSLAVDVTHRRRGIATALARWRVDAAEELAGPRAVILANIQRGNTASLGNAARWATAMTPPAINVPVPTHARPPRMSRAYSIDFLSDELLPVVVDGVSAATQAHNFSRVWTPTSLKNWLTASPFSTPVNEYLVVQDRSGAVVAGLALHDESRIRTLRVLAMPRSVALANVALRVVPRDGTLRNVVVEHFWHAHGHADAARALWQHARWAHHDHASHLLATVDARSPLRHVIGVRPWTPTTRIVTAVRADIPLSPERLIAPML